jgi:hypothetical protein
MAGRCNARPVHHQRFQPLIRNPPRQSEDYVMHSTCAAPKRPSLSVERLLDAPLPQLLAALDVELHDSSITDASFFGAVVERRDGQLILAMPGGRPAFEHDTVARYLLAQAFEVDLPQLPAPFVTSKA